MAGLRWRILISMISRYRCERKRCRTSLHACVTVECIERRSEAADEERTVLDLQAELHGAGQSHPELYEFVVGLKRRYDLHPCAVRPGDSLSLRRDSEREAVQDVVKRF